MTARRTGKFKRLILLMTVFALILSGFVTTAYAASFSAIVTADTMNVYSDASLSQKIASLKQGSVVIVSNSANGLALITNPQNGAVGVARVSDMAAVADVSKPGAVSVNGAKVYAKASTSSTSMAIEKGFKVNVLYIDGNWAMVENGSGGVGYMLLSQLYIPGVTETEPEATAAPHPAVGRQAMVITQTARAYKKASTSSGYNTVQYGYIVNVQAVNGNWVRCEKDGFIRYLKMDVLYIPGVSENTPAPTAKPTEQAPIATATPHPAAGKQAMVITPTARAYNKASTSSQYITVEYGYIVNVLAVNGNWAMVEKDGYTRYMKYDVLYIPGVSTSTPQPTAKPTEQAPVATATPHPATGKQAMVIVDGARAYLKPSTGSRYNTIEYGYIVTVQAISGDWVFCTADGYTRYMKMNTLYIPGVSQSTPAPTATNHPAVGKQAMVITQTARAYKKASTGSAYNTVQYGYIVDVTAVSGDWVRCTAGGYTRYMKMDTLYIPGVSENTPAPTATQAPNATATPHPAVGRQAMVVVNNARAYKKANTNSSSIAVEYGYIVEVVGVIGNWAQVYRDGYTRYMKMDTLYIPGVSQSTPAPTAAAGPTATPHPAVGKQAMVATTDARAYKKASLSSDSFSVDYGYVVKVCAVSGEWVLVQSGENYAYMLMRDLYIPGVSTSTPAPTATATPKVEAVYVVNDPEGLTVYKSFSTTSKVLGSLGYGTEVNLMAKNGDWALIEKNGNYGFCKLAGLMIKEDFIGLGDGLEVGKFEATVIAPSTAMHITNTKSTTLALGTAVTVYAYNNTYAYVGVGEAKGYVEIKYLSRETYSQLSGGSSGGNVTTLQKMLETLGFMDGEATGTYDSLTQQAVARFQSACGMSSTGVADVHTLRVLNGGSAPTSPMLSLSLASGASGENVVRLQTRLYEKGYLTKSSSIDGDYGSITSSAIRLFQTAVGISSTGKADTATIRALYNVNAPRFSGNQAADEETTPEVGPPSDNAKVETVIAFGYEQLGKEYVYGAVGPDTYDCSGFTRACFKQVGITLPHSAQQQGYRDATGGKIEGISGLMRGDLVFFNTVSDNDLCDHVGIYLGNYQFIHASSGADKVVISSLKSGYYNNVYSWGRRAL